ncbi:SGNH/GDSL hydrolase family protein [Luteococcus sp. H138]|uniref:SGNH/GDSL hydrolase family protein n=1 Tax=unclassified Luteococcus TaxID=2639923 RepID=UPI00313C7742
MASLVGLLRPVAIRQGERTIGRLAGLPVPLDAPHGLVTPPNGAGGLRLSLAVLGDESALGVGGSSLSEGLPGLLARELAERERREVLWQVVGEQDATSLGLHHRLVPQLSPATDVVVLLVGMHDLLARRPVTAWRAELSATLDLLARVPEVVVCGCPPIHRAPLLRWPLTALLERDARALDDATRELCVQHGRTFVSLMGVAVRPEDFASDGLHPGDPGYRRWAQEVTAAF